MKVPFTGKRRSVRNPQVAVTKYQRELYQRSRAMFATLDFTDVIWIAVIVFFIVSAATVFRPSDQSRLRRIERKLDALLQHQGIAYVDPASPEGLSAEVQALADQGQKIQAIALHREKTGVSLKEAKDAIEAHQQRRDNRAGPGERR